MTAQLYFRLAGGGVAARTVSGTCTAEPKIPEGATALSKKAYERELADIEAKRQAYATEVRAADDRTRQGDYEALVALKVPEDTARRLTGYRPEVS